MEAAFSNLRLDADDYEDAQDMPPVYRSGADLAFSSWATVGGDPVGAECKQLPSRCMPMEAWDAWDYDDVQSNLLGGACAPPPRLVVALTPHRIEGEESLICSLRHFLVVVSLVDGATSAPLPSWDARLRATLVFADTGEPVPAQRGETPLTGETDGVRPHNGEGHLRLRAAALSYRHNRRAFAVRVDADDLPNGPAFGCSQPMRAVARLPNETKTSVKPGAFGAAKGAPPSGSAPPPPTAPTMPTAPPAAPPTPLVRILPPSMPTIAVLDDDEDAAGGFDDDECMLVDESPPPPAAPPPPRCAHTYTSHMDLMDELKVQGDMLERVTAQQHFILTEISRIRSSGAAPPVVMPPFRAATPCM